MKYMKYFGIENKNNQNVDLNKFRISFLFFGSLLIKKKT